MALQTARAEVEAAKGDKVKAQSLCARYETELAAASDETDKFCDRVKQLLDADPRDPRFLDRQRRKASALEAKVQEGLRRSSALKDLQRRVAKVEKRYGPRWEEAMLPVMLWPLKRR